MKEVAIITCRYCQHEMRVPVDPQTGYIEPSDCPKCEGDDFLVIIKLEDKNEYPLAL